MPRCYDQTIDHVRASHKAGEEYEIRDVFRPQKHYWVKVTVACKGGHILHEITAQRNDTLRLDCLRRPYVDTLPADVIFQPRTVVVPDPPPPLEPVPASGPVGQIVFESLPATKEAGERMAKSRKHKGCTFAVGYETRISRHNGFGGAPEVVETVVAATLLIFKDGEVVGEAFHEVNYGGYAKFNPTWGWNKVRVTPEMLSPPQWVIEAVIDRELQLRDQIAGRKAVVKARREAHAE